MVKRLMVKRLMVKFLMPLSPMTGKSIPCHPR